MSGHSHWAGIKHKKGINDVKRAKIFTKHGKIITLVAREGGGNVNANLRLKLAVDRARADNMPKENIERAIRRGAGEIKGGAEIENVFYEAYGPGGIMMVIKATTDNKNRTVSEIKSILSDFGGRLGEPGSVTWNFGFSGGKYQPQNASAVGAETETQYEKLLEALDEQGDVEEVYDNLRENRETEIMD